MPRVVDFDSFRSERKEETVTFLIGGEEYALPASIPASLAIDVIRMQTTLAEDDEVPVESLNLFGSSLFGPTIWEALLMKHRVTVTELGPLLEQVMAIYTDSAPKETEQTETTPESSATKAPASA